MAHCLLLTIFNREIVKTFTGVLKKAVLATNTLHYLDFFESMLTPDQASLNPLYELDGTHMNPKYIPLLEAALHKVTQNS